MSISSLGPACKEFFELFKNYSKITFRSKPFWIAAILFLIAFYITRSPAYIFFPYPEYLGDTKSYLKITNSLASFEFPDLYARTPGYPIYILIAKTLFGGHYFGVIIFNSLMFAFSGLFLVSAFNYYSRNTTVYAGIIMALFCFNDSTLRHEFMLYADSLSCSLVIICFSLLMLMLKRPSHILTFLLSFTVGFAIWVKPGNLYLIVTLLFVLAYFWVHKIDLKSKILLIAPAISMVLMIMFYNLFSLGFFSYVPESGHTRLFSTHWFLEESDEYPDHVNEMIRKSLASVTPQDMELFKNTWNLDAFRWRFHYYSEKSVYPFFKSHDPSLKPWLHKITGDAVSRHPSYYFKYVAAMLKAYFFLNTEMTVKWGLTAQFQREVEAHRHLNDNKDEAFANLLEPISFSEYNESWRMIDEPYTLYNSLYTTLLPLMKNKYYSYLFFFVFFWSCWRVYKTRLKELWPFMIFVFTTANIGAGIIICLSVPPFLRYSYPYDYIYYLLPLFMVLLLSNDIKTSIKDGFSSFKEKLNKKQRLELKVIGIIALCFAVIMGARSLNLLSYYRTSPGLANVNEKAANALLIDHEVKSFMYYANKLASIGNTKKAHDAVNRILLLNPRHVDALLMQAHVYRTENDSDNALKIYNAVLSINPKLGKAYYSIGDMFMRMNDQAKVLQVFKLARKQIPNFHPKQYQPMSAQDAANWDRALAQ